MNGASLHLSQLILDAAEESRQHCHHFHRRRTPSFRTEKGILSAAVGQEKKHRNCETKSRTSSKSESFPPGPKRPTLNLQNFASASCWQALTKFRNISRDRDHSCCLQYTKCVVDAARRRPSQFRSLRNTQTRMCFNEPLVVV